MQKRLFYILMLLTSLGFSQETFKAVVENESTGRPLSSVHILNLTQVVGTITNAQGVFEIPATPKDTLYLTYLGFKPLKIAVTNDMVKFGNAVFKMTELAFALEEIIVKPYQLTGFLDIDARNVPINAAQRYRIPGLPNGGYEARNNNKGALNKTLGALFNPADFLHNLFGKNPQQMRRLKKMRDDEEIKNLLASKFDLQVLVQLLQLDRESIDEVLINCSYSDAFIQQANDLQILEAISKCYEEYRVLQF